MEFARIDRNNNMGLVRYVLALAVILHHFNVLFATDYPWIMSGYHAVGGFFALSGFLIYGSYRRSPSLRYYIARRMRKIMPPYLFIVLACALLLYFAADAATRLNYFSWAWVKYLAANLSFLNFLCPTLPGVFTHNPIPAVNASLWTMKVEWVLYLSIPPVLWLVDKLRLKTIWTVAAIMLLSCCYRLWFHQLYSTTGNELYMILSRQVFGQLSYFYAGVAIYLFFEQFMRYKWTILVVALLAASAHSAIPYFAYFLEPIVVPTLVIWFSMVGKWGTWAGINDNISYEMYLFHWPVLQLVWQYGTPLALPAWILLLVAIAIIVALSSLCWFTIGKRILYPRQ
ncbi:MAG: acyltransferase [Muribaculum sp.]|nr:acyltransferase [Muribaculaceae bacterium]MCM1081728.1 acyltransferase [Muribaculum sp.]